MWKVIKNGISHEYNGLFYFIVWFALILVLAGCMNSNTYRMNGIFFAVVFLAVEGLCQILKWFKKIAPVLLGVVCVVYVVCFMRFSHFYYGEGYTANTYMKIDNFGLPIQEGISFIEGDALLCQKITYVWERSIYYAVSKWLPPQEFDVIGDSYGVWNQYWFGSLGEITPDYNYMVPHGIFEDYCRQLREAGFEEKRFEHYSVFFKR